MPTNKTIDQLETITPTGDTNLVGSENGQTGNFKFSVLTNLVETGIKIEWHDTFFRQFDGLWPVNYFNRQRTKIYPGRTIDHLIVQDNELFDGNQIVKNNTGADFDDLGQGFVLYMDELDAEEGDIVTSKFLAKCNNGVSNIRFYYRFYDTSDAPVSGLLNASFIPTADKVTAFSVEKTVPSNASYVVIWLSIPTMTAELTVYSLWSYKGLTDDSENWPRFNNDPWSYKQSTLNTKEIEQLNSDVTENTNDLDYSIIKETVVNADSETLELSVTDPLLNQSYGSNFTGWGEEYSVTPGLEFNAVEIKQLGRKSDVQEENFWSTVNVVVRTASSSSRNGVVVAVGSSIVNPYDEILEDTRIILRDPISNDPITLSELNLDSEYFIGVFVRNKDGVAAYSSPHRATQSNTLGQSYYSTSIDSDGGTWSVFTGNFRVGVNHLLLTNPSESLGRKPSTQFLSEIYASDKQNRKNFAAWGDFNLRSYKEKVAKMLTLSDELVIGLFGDSWVNTGIRVHTPVFEWLQSEYGCSAGGYVSANSDISPPPLVSRIRSGTWSNFRSSSSAVGPDNAHATSSDTSAELRVSATGLASRYVIHYLAKNGGGTFEYKLGSAGTPISVDTSSASTSYETIEVSGSDTLYINVTGAGAGGVTIAGVDVRNDTNGEVVFHKLGSGGAKSEHFAGQDASFASSAYTALGLDVAMILLGTNDNSADESLSEFKSNIKTLADRILAVNPLCDIVLIGAGPNGMTGKAYPIDSYNNKMYDLARENDWAFIDLKKFFGEYQDANSRGLYSDDVHPNAEGGNVIGRAIIKSLLDK